MRCLCKTYLNVCISILRFWILIHTIRYNYTLEETFLTIYQTNGLPKEIENSNPKRMIQWLWHHLSEFPNASILSATHRRLTISDSFFKWSIIFPWSFWLWNTFKCKPSSADKYRKYADSEVLITWNQQRVRER